MICHIEGDLIELYRSRIAAVGKLKADLLFAADVILLFRPGIIRNFTLGPSTNHSMMLINYLKVGLRNMHRHRAFSFINIFGLALAMSVAMLIILMIADQLRYDKFHSDSDRIYRILSAPRYATSPEPLSKTLKEEYSIVEDATHLIPGFTGDAKAGGKSTEMRGYFTDPSFFRVLGFRLEHGDMAKALVNPNSIVISSRLAQILFGKADVVGESLEFDDRKLSFPQDFDGKGAPPVPWGSFTITGIFDQNRYKSHLQFDVLASESSLPALYLEKKFEDNSERWDSYWRTYTFVMVKPNIDPLRLDSALADVVRKKYKGLEAEHLKGFRLTAQAIDDIQFAINGNDTGSRFPGVLYYFFGGLALIIILSACLNYTNLSIARALTRAKEIGVRKVTGANRTALTVQFMTESILTSLFAMMMAMGILYFLRPAFLDLWVNRYLKFELPHSPAVYVLFIVFAIVIGVICGIYPAFHLSSFKPVKALKALSESGSGKMKMYKILSVIQFVVSLLFISTSTLIFKQFDHYSNFDYGFNATNVVNVQLQGMDYGKVANEFRQIPGVERVSASDLIPATGSNNGNQFKKSGAPEEEYRFFSELNVDEQFIPNLNLEVVAGTNITPASTDGSLHVMLNEAAVKELGFSSAHDAVGTVIENKWGGEQLKIIGVVENFRYMLLLNQHEIGGLVLRNRPALFQYANVKIGSPDRDRVIASMISKWNAIDPVHPIKYKLFAHELAETHQALVDIVSIIGFVATLSIVISCLGLLGMATYTAERKRKEIGIRKTLGANAGRILTLLSGGFVKLLAIAIVIGAPASYFLNQLWLQTLPNRTEFTVWNLLFAVAILVLLGLITIGSQTVRASNENPVDALKND